MVMNMIWVVLLNSQNSTFIVKDCEHYKQEEEQTQQREMGSLSVPPLLHH